MSLRQKPDDWNPALAWPQPEEEDPGAGAEEFEVVGETFVDGHAPGTRFKAVISDERKALLGSHIRCVEPEDPGEEPSPKAAAPAVSAVSAVSARQPKQSQQSQHDK